jgi:hypothetical protein
MIDVQREYMYESQDCTRYQYNRDCPALDDSTNFNSHLNRHSRTYEAQDCTSTVLYGFVDNQQTGAVRTYRIRFILKRIKSMTMSITY